MPITRRSTPGVSGPRSTRSPTKTARLPGRMPGTGGAARLVSGQLVAEVGEQRLEFGAAAVHVADDVERAGLIPQVVEELGPGQQGGTDLRFRPEHVHPPEPLALETAQTAPQLVALTPDHVRTERPVGPGGVPADAHPLGQVEDDGDRQDVVLPGEVEQLLAALLLHVRRVDDREASGREPLAGDEVQDVEGVLAGRLVVLVVGDQAAAEVAGDHLGRREVGAGEGRLAGPAGADEHDQA